MPTRRNAFVTQVRLRCLVQTGRVTATEPVLRAFVRADWSAVCNVHEPAARSELSWSGRDQRSFRPMPDEEDLDTFLRLNSAVVACVDGVLLVRTVQPEGRRAMPAAAYLRGCDEKIPRRLGSETDGPPA